MKFIEHSTCELICETLTRTSLRVGAVVPITEDSEIHNNVLVKVREITGDECRVDIVEGDLIEVADEDRVATLGVLPKGYYVTRDNDGDWVLIPPADQTIFSEPGEPALLAEAFLLDNDTKKTAVRVAHQYLTNIGVIRK